MGKSLRLRMVLFSWLSLAAAALPAGADNRLPKIGILVPPIQSIFETPLLESLRELGYVDHNTAFLDVRRSDGSPEEWRKLADDLVRAKVDLIIAIGTPAARAALDATSAIPIVFGVGDAVSTGLVSSLAKPQTNGTGVTTMSTEVSAKRLELLLEIVPKARRVAYLYSPGNPLGVRMHDEVQDAAAKRRVRLEAVEVRNVGEIQAALDRISSIQPDGLLVSSEVLFIPSRDQIIKAVARTRLPTVFPWRLYALDGGLTSYGASNEEGMRRVAAYADRVLKRHQAFRSSHRTAGHVPLGREPKGRQGARDHHPRVVSIANGRSYPMIRLASERRHNMAGCDERPNKRFDTDPQQQRFAPLFRAGQSRRSAAMTEGVE